MDLLTAATTTNVIKILLLGFLSFIIAFIAVPPLTHFLYKYRLWRTIKKDKSIDGQNLVVIPRVHLPHEKPVPRLGGLLVWIIPLVVSLLIMLLSKTGIPLFVKLNFLSRGQTWLPLTVLIGASLLGLADDLLQIRGKGKYVGGGLSLFWRISIMALLGLLSGWWFYSKLGWTTIFIPPIGDINIGFFYVPLFIMTTLGCWAGGVIDGIDGLAGGALAIIFSAFSIIAFSQGQIDLASFCAVLAGTILAFLWFNIPPARFYMGESGMMGLTATLAAVAFLTNSVFVLPIIAGLLVIEAGTVILQLLSKKFCHKKIFICSPIHHHLEAIGWSQSKITMRFWILGMIMAIIGVIIKLLS